MYVLAYLLTIVVGIVLGMMGGGGSILTLPILVYLFNISPIIATGYSLFIVGFSSLIAVVPKYRQGLVHLPTALAFGLPSMLAVLTTRTWLLPAIPMVIGTWGGWVLTKNLMLMVFFALIMIAASWFMLKPMAMPDTSERVTPKQYYWLILVQGLAEGGLTGLVGAGGGFLIIPALVLLSQLPMKQAVATSLLIIAVKSLIGFIGDVVQHTPDWALLLSITSITLIGVWVGDAWSRKVDGAALKKAFGFLVLVMGIYIIIKEIWLR